MVDYEFTLPFVGRFASVPTYATYRLERYRVLIRSSPRVIQHATDAFPARARVGFDFAAGSLFISWLLFNERVLGEINAISVHCIRDINAFVDNTRVAS